MKYSIIVVDFLQLKDWRKYIMQLPVEVKVRGIRVLTSAQIAACYDTTRDRIKQNFRENKSRYEEGKHYIMLIGDELRKFKNEVGNSYPVNEVNKNKVRDSYSAESKAQYQFETEFKYAKSLYLWTEKGALLHAKSLNTDKAWEVYDYLVDFYFRAKGEPKPKTYREIRETALAEKQQAAPKRNSRVVVDAPENPAIQKSMQEIRKYLTSIDVALIECNKYCCEESYVRVRNMLDTLWLSLGNKILDFRDNTPKLIEKVY